jgi:hypothetical protein
MKSKVLGWSAGIFLLLFSVLPVMAYNSMVTEPADTLGRGHFNLQVSGAYAKFDADTTGFEGANFGIRLQPYYGILPFMDVSVGIPLFYTMPKTGKNYFSIGDMDVWTKLMLIDPHKKPVGVGVVLDVYLPTGKKRSDLEDPTHQIPTGAGSTSVYVTGLVSKYFGPLGIHGNLGYHRENIGGDPLPPDAPAPNYIDWAGAANFKVWRFITAYTEVYGNFQKNSEANPVNVGTGLSIGLTPLFTIDVAGVFGAKNAEESYRFGGMFTIGF